MKTIKVINIIIFSIAVYFIALGGYVFFINPQLFPHDFAKTIGSFLQYLFLFQVALFIALFIIKQKLLSPSINKYFSLIVKYIYSFHKSIGALLLAMAWFHVSILFDINQLLDKDHMSGYFIVGLLILALLIRFTPSISNENKKLGHLILGTLAIIPFLLHI